jgi:hypothetical protein
VSFSCDVWVLLDHFCKGGIICRLTTFTLFSLLWEEQKRLYFLERFSSLKRDIILPSYKHLSLLLTVHWAWQISFSVIYPWISYYIYCMLHLGNKLRLSLFGHIFQNIFNEKSSFCVMIWRRCCHFALLCQRQKRYYTMRLQTQKLKLLWIITYMQ